MTEPARLALVDRALKEAPAHELAEVLDEVLRKYYCAISSEIYLIDLRLALLEPVLASTAPGVPLVGTPAGRAYCDQVPVREVVGGGVVLNLPMAVRGDRIGVLNVRLPELPDAAGTDELVALAGTVAHAITLAEVATDRYRRARRPERLTLAAEMQWQLLPVRAVDGKSYRLAGQLEPAYAVRGDNFDWSQEAETLTVAVTNGMGEGVTASMLTTLAITALRNARRSGADLVEQAALADQAVWSHHTGAEYVATLLIQLDLQSGSVLAIDAGSPRIWRVRQDGVAPISLEAQLPLGMFDGTEYVTQAFELEAGDRLFILTDGIYGAVLEDRNYTMTSLRRALQSSRLLPPAEAVRALMSDLRAFLRDQELDDDAVAVCLDWLGPHRVAEELVLPPSTS
ncbi:PP2C family protein-serine/threonine phosphatase [Saccharopolyspora sp. NPDC050642]|uniref:PP2C family protein-serine/threonine phosphatase n=1 Tax=Saccharopolyspora sp. NPDC050642 TaxID=3157099 RepID=UPI0033E5BA7E